MKNKWNRWIAVILLLVIIVIAVTACGAPTSIVGKWQGVMEPNSYMEFFKDGSIELTSPEGTLTGTYEIEEGVPVEGTGDKVNQLTITITGMFEGPEGEYGRLYAIYEIEGKILTLIQQNNISTWRRAD